MKIKWSPRRADERIEYRQPSHDVLSINGVEYDMSDEGVAVFDIPSEASEMILSATRDGDGLHLVLSRPYQEYEKGVWENPNYLGTGQYRGEREEDYRNDEALV